jgi:hypothetical protein
MYKIINVTDKSGVVKLTALEDIRSICPDMTGEIIYKEFMQVGNSFCFVWSGDSGRMMRTSPIESFSESGKKLHITTMNTEYYLEEL